MILSHNGFACCRPPCLLQMRSCYGWIHLFPSTLRFGILQCALTQEQVFYVYACMRACVGGKERSEWTTSSRVLDTCYVRPSSKPLSKHPVVYTTSVGPEVRALLDRACKEQISPAQCQSLCAEINSDPKLVPEDEEICILSACTLHARCYLIFFSPLWPLVSHLLYL